MVHGCLDIGSCSVKAVGVFRVLDIADCSDSQLYKDSTGEAGEYI